MELVLKTRRRADCFPETTFGRDFNGAGFSPEVVYLYAAGARQGTRAPEDSCW